MIENLSKRVTFAINSRSDRRGSCGISDYTGSVSLINTVMKPKGEMNPKYFNWLFHTIQFADEFYKWGHGIVDDLWTTNWQDMKKISVPVPNIDVQIQIADFLDTKCNEMDALTADIQTQIETLEQYKKSVITEAVTKGLNPDAEMKDSGIEWIGSIPKDWDIIKVKRLLKYLLKNLSKKWTDECDTDPLYWVRECRRLHWRLYSNRSEDGFHRVERDLVIKVMICLETKTLFSQSWNGWFCRR